MQTINKITIDLEQRQSPPTIYAVQFDANTRAVAVTLAAGGIPWAPGDGLTVSVACQKPDGTSAWYDTLPNGNAACIVSENVVTATLAPEVLTVAGQVNAAIVFQNEHLDQLATFPFVIAVAENPAAGDKISNSYYNLQTLGQINEAVFTINQKINDLAASVGLALQGMIDDTSVGGKAWSSRKIVKTIEENTLKTAIICTVQDDDFIVKDSADYPLIGMVLYGKSAAGAGSGEIRLYIPQEVETTTIIRHPRSVTAPEGTSVTFSVIASGIGLTYRWQYRQSSSSSWKNASTPGFDEPKMILEALETRDGNQYRCVVTDATGKSVNSSVATLALGSQLLYGEYSYASTHQLSIAIPNALRGIPVTSGGNYTDNGRKWMCDTVENGQYVQRIGYIASYAGEEIPGEYTSSTGALTTGAEVLYVLAEPVVTELDEETVAAIKALHTYKPNTTIINDAGAGMAVEYVADPKTYIDNKFTELQNAILATGANV